MIRSHRVMRSGHIAKLNRDCIFKKESTYSKGVHLVLGSSSIEKHAQQSVQDAITKAPLPYIALQQANHQILDLQQKTHRVAGRGSDPTHTEMENRDRGGQTASRDYKISSYKQTISLHLSFKSYGKL